MTALDPKIQLLSELERKVRWLASWTVHHANHIRPSRDGVKVGGHQASSASLSTIMTALYFSVLRPKDKVAVKPHASPNFHAIQYLLGRQTQQQLAQFRAFGGAQSYPSITKDQLEVDFSTGSVGLGVAATLFSSLVQDYIADHQPQSTTDSTPGRMIALLGDAELDEGNIFEALLEGWKKGLRNTWWIIDYNRQSLDGVMHDHLYQRIMDFFASVGWQVVNLKYGKLMQLAFSKPGGKALQQWIDNCPNQLYSTLTFKGGAAWRERLTTDLKDQTDCQQLLASYDDDQLQALMTNLGGHDMALLLEQFEQVNDDTPRCFVAYTIKGYGLPLAGHKDNHAGMITPEQMAQFQTKNGIEDGQQWQPFAGLSTPEEQLQQFLDQVPMKQRPKPAGMAAPIPVSAIEPPAGATSSTQVAFGKIMNQLAGRKDALAEKIVTTSPDVASSTNLSGWINKRSVYHHQAKDDTFKQEKVASPLNWQQTPQGQHIELGIAESNLFSILTALGQAEKHFGTRLLPIGTLYDPFICRGLDALNYGCYQDARFMLVATPSGISLAPEGGAHQSFNTPMIGMAQPNLVSFEPSYSDELAAIMSWALAHMQAPEGSSVYLRLSTRPMAQPERTMTPQLQQQIIAGGYWCKAPNTNTTIAIVYIGAVAPQANEALQQLQEDLPDAALLAITSADRLYHNWSASKKARHQGKREQIAVVEALLNELPRSAAMVTVCDGHPAALSWLGAVHGHKVESLGVDAFGQSGDLIDLYHHYGIDTSAILDGCAASCLQLPSNPVSAQGENDVH